MDYLAAAVYLDDADLFTEHIRWLGEVLAARDLPRTGIGVVLDVLVAGLHDFPVAQRCLREGRGAWPRHEPRRRALSPAR